MNAPANIKPIWPRMDPEKRDELLIEYCRQGLSAGKIADKFVDATRSAVIGRVHRLQKTVPSLKLGGGTRPGPKPGQPCRKKAGGEKTHRKPSPRMAIIPGGAPKINQYDFAARAEQRASSPGLEKHLVTGEPRRPIDDASIVPLSLRLKLVQLTENTCKWPTGDPQAEDFGFCGHPSGVAGPYCTYHTRIAYQPVSERRRAS